MRKYCAFVRTKDSNTPEVKDFVEAMRKTFKLGAISGSFSDDEVEYMFFFDENSPVTMEVVEIPVEECVCIQSM